MAKLSIAALYTAIFFFPCREGARAQAPLKIMSYNMRIASPPSKNWNGTDLEAIADVIRRERPALVALQEVDAYTERSGKHSHQARELGRLTGMYAFFAKAVDRSGGDYGVAVLSRFPITDSLACRLPVQPGSEGEIRAVAVIGVKPEGMPKLYFLSAHLDHQRDSDRQLQIDSLLRIVKPLEDAPVILGADLNMPPENPLVGRLGASLQPLNEKHLLTFPSDIPEVTLDYIMVNAKARELLRLKTFSTVNETYASDHLPLTGVFEVHSRDKTGR